MVTIHINQTLKSPRQGWAMLRGGQKYQAHMGNSYVDGVL